MNNRTTPHPARISNKETPDTWETKELLVLGMTHPQYSTKYKELVCTGAIEEDTKRLIRIHPMPKRYLDEEQRFKNFQRIEVRVRRNHHDARPESIRVDFDSVQPLDEIQSNNHEARRVYLEGSPSLAASVEELKERNKRDGTSLGIIMPKSIDCIRIRQRSATERAEWFATEKKLLNQTQLSFIRPPMRIDFPEAEFVIGWTCNDARCVGHESGLKTWGIHELYRKLRRDPKRDEKTEAALRKMLDLTKRDVFMFLGTFHNHQTTWGLMDAYCPPKRVVPSPSRQLGLFDRQ